MKSINSNLLKLFIFLTFIFVVFPSGMAQAEQRIAVVDLQRALNSVNEGKKAMSQIEAEANLKKKELEKMEKEMTDMLEKLKKDQMVLSKEAIQTQLQTLQTKQAEYQKKRGEVMQTLSEKEYASAKKIIENLKLVTAEIAKKKNYDIVFENSKDTVLYSANADDITDELIEAYNKGKK